MKRLIFATLIFMTQGLVSLVSLDQFIVLGKDENWQGLVTRQALVTKQGRGGYLDLVLKDSEYTVSGETDLLLHFNELPVREETLHYSIKESSVQINREYARYGDGCGIFQGDGGLSLIPRTGSLFSPKTTWNDFTIEFWLYPASLSDGESLFSWKGFRLYNKTLIPQKIECRVENRSLVWTFENFFVPANGELSRFEIKSVEKLIPRQWRHHLLRFDSRNGYIEYTIDGVPSAGRYSSPLGLDSPPFAFPFIGEAENTVLQVGGRFTGFMDELRICREYVKKPIMGKYFESRGNAVSRVFDLGYSGTVVKRIEAMLETPRDSEINFYVRCSDTFTTIDRLKADWIPFVPGTGFNGKLNGRYLQLMINFYPDGRNEISPRLFEIDIFFEPDLPPVSPTGLKAVPGNSKVTLSWKSVNEDDVRGYYVFYGEGPLNYMGEDAKQGASPINVGNVTSLELTGLVNGKLYYFAVAAYDSSNPPHLSEFLEEKSARPSEVLK